MWRVFKEGDFSGPYFSAFGPEKTPYLDAFHAVKGFILSKKSNQMIYYDHRDKPEIWLIIKESGAIFVFTVFVGLKQIIEKSVWFW